MNPKGYWTKVQLTQQGGGGIKVPDAQRLASSSGCFRVFPEF